MERDERRGTQGQHKPFQIALSLNNAAVWRREGGGGDSREEEEVRRGRRTIRRQAGGNIVCGVGSRSTEVEEERGAGGAWRARNGGEMQSLVDLH